MDSFTILFEDNTKARFKLYTAEAPLTCSAFKRTMPFELVILHARISGQEIWSPDAPKLDIIQENATIFAEAGEVVIAPVSPARNKIIGCIGIFYGEGKLLDCANVFAKVWDKDVDVLKKQGENIWLHGSQKIRFFTT